MMGRVEAVCISEAKGTVKEPCGRAELRANHGLAGDAHAGPWHRQVSLLARESIDRLRAIMPEIGDGAFAENVVTTGIDWRTVAIGDRVALGETALLEVTQIGKECHAGCAIQQTTGECIMPTEGIFCRVLTGGTIAPGDRARVVKQSEPGSSATPGGESQ